MTKLIWTFILMMSFPQISLAYDFKSNGIYYNIISIDLQTVEVTYERKVYDSFAETYKGYVNIPETVEYEDKTFKVISIGEIAFKNCYLLTSVSIPNTVNSIKLGAFYGCDKLISITIPDSVTEIESQLFYGCYSLSYVKLPNSIIEIPYNCFYGCSKLTSIEIPESVTRIGSSCFQGTGLISLKIPEKVTDINSKAFYGCGSLTSIELPESLNFLGEYVFFSCISLTSVKLPNNLIEIPSFTFTQCFNLSVVNIPSFCQKIGTSAFHICRSLSSITLPNTLQSINKLAFSYCSSLSSINIPNSLVWLGEDVFLETTNIIDYNCDKEEYLDLFCSSVKNLTLGENIRELTCLFNNWNELENLWVKSTNPPTFRVTDNPFSDAQYSFINVFVPKSQVSNYQNAEVWKNFKKIIGSEFEEDPSELPICPRPQLYIDGVSIIAECEVPYAKVTIDVKPIDFISETVNTGKEVSLTGQYNIEAVANAEGYASSEVVKAILFWTKPSFDVDGLETFDVETRKAVLIQSIGDYMQLSGTDANETIQLYDLNGYQIYMGQANDNTTLLPIALQKGQIYILCYGDQRIKYKF